MEHRYTNLSKQLYELGYKYTLHPDSLLLVEKLLGDLIETTENLRKYMKIAEAAVEERDNLQFGAEPYKCDNAKLVKECNELHSALQRVNEQNEKQQKALKKQIASLEKERRDFVDTQRKLRQRVRDLELEAVRKTDRYLQNQCRPSERGKFQSASAPVLLKSGGKEGRREVEITAAMALADEKIANLMKEIGKLKTQHLELLDVNSDLNQKLSSRDKEIQRLKGMLEGGRPNQAVNNDCCYKDVNLKVLNLQDEVNYLQKVKADLECKLKEARCKQHEAMKNALTLAERNKQLEKELRDIDEMALTVEQECNSTVKTNKEKVKRLQERMNDAIAEVQSLESQLVAIKRERESLIADKEAVEIEKKHLQNVLESALDDKKNLTNKINKFTIIEQDLNNEIDRLVRMTADQKRIIAELKGRSMTYSIESDLEKQHVVDKQKKGSDVQISPSKTKNSQDYSKNDGLMFDSTERFNANQFMDKLKYMMNDELNKRFPYKKTDSLDRVKSERDFYIKEYQKLVEKCQNMLGRTSKDDSGSVTSLLKRLTEKDDLISNLQHENQILAKEKHNLVSRLENVRDFAEDTDSVTMRSSLKRSERERDLLKSNMERAEEERDSIKNRLKILADTHASEISRYEKKLTEYESQIKALEEERRSYMLNNGSRRDAFANLEEQYASLKEKFNRSQSEITQMKITYSQLKTLNEQSDRALLDTQAQLQRLQQDVASHEERQSSFDVTNNTLNKEVAALKKDITTLRRTLSEMDQEKDNLLAKLDEKTERIALLEQEVGLKDAKLNKMESNMSELAIRVSSAMDEKNMKESELKNTSSEVASMRNEILRLSKAKDAALQECKRLQEDLAACTADNRNCHTELDIARRQIDDLKRQLQHYVAEVKRIEDMIAQKEVERSEMLDQFRSLSHEATILENNNHSLENEATQSKVQLSVALDHATGLERRLEEQNGLIRTYERQISELTTQIATLEMQVKHYQAQQERAQTELASVQEMCVNLDKQKQDLQRQLREQQHLKDQAEHNLSTLRRNSETLKKTLQQDQTTVESLETLLAENRRQAVEQRLLNQDLQSEILRLKKQIEEMEMNLASTTERLDIYQEKALEYSEQNKQLRREITDERFFQSKDEEQSSSKYPSF